MLKKRIIDAVYEIYTKEKMPEPFSFQEIDGPTGLKLIYSRPTYLL
jgi:hypothetical protein